MDGYLMKNYQQYADLFKALSDANRLSILDMLCKGERCACKILEKFNITQPTLSHHMKILSDCGMVNKRKEGKWMYYSISKTGGKTAIRMLKELSSVTENLKAKKCCDKDCL